MVIRAKLCKTLNACSPSRLPLHSYRSDIERLYEMEKILSTGPSKQYAIRNYSTLTNSMQTPETAELENNLESWCNKLITMSFEVSNRCLCVFVVPSVLTHKPKGSDHQEKNVAASRLLFHYCAQ